MVTTIAIHSLLKYREHLIKQALRFVNSAMLKALTKQAQQKRGLTNGPFSVFYGAILILNNILSQ